jgi:two-component system NarL family sensor kinase
MSWSGLDEITLPLVVGTLLLGLLMTFILYFIFLYQRQRQQFDWERQQFQQALVQTQMEIREQTLNQMAQELHDNLGQIASLTKMKLGLVSAQVADSDRLLVDDSKDLLKRLITDIKSMSTTLNSERLQTLGLVNAIRKDFEMISRSAQVKTELKSQKENYGLPAESEIFLYRISQELINNTMKHSGATEVRLTFEMQDDKLLVSYVDNGRGFDISALSSNGGGEGLVNMRNRCRMIKASLDIKTTPGAGLKVKITVPIQKNK